MVSWPWSTDHGLNDQSNWITNRLELMAKTMQSHPTSHIFILDPQSRTSLSFATFPNSVQDARPSSQGKEMRRSFFRYYNLIWYSQYVPHILGKARCPKFVASFKRVVYFRLKYERPPSSKMKLLFQNQTLIPKVCPTSTYCDASWAANMIWAALVKTYE